MLTLDPFETFVLRYGRYVRFSTNDIGTGKESVVLLRQIYEEVCKIYRILNGHGRMN